MKDQIRKILKDGDTEERIKRIVAFSDLLISATSTEDVPRSENLNYIALELFSNARTLQDIYTDLLTVLKENLTE